MDNGNLLGLVSHLHQADGTEHAVADVWFAKDGTVEPAKAAPSLSEVLVAPAVDLLPAPLGTAASPVGTVNNTGPAQAQIHAIVPKDDELNRPTPLI